MEEVVIGRDEDDLKKYGKNGTVPLGRHLVGTGEDAHLTTPVLLDVLRPHIIIITGKRGTGKSFSMGIIAEEMAKLPEEIRDNLCGLLIDTQGIFWTMKFPNEKELIMLKDWDLKPMGFNIFVCVPEGQEKIFSEAGVEFDSSFSIMPSELSSEDWINVFNLNPNEPLGILLQMAISKLPGKYSIDDIISKIMEGKEFLSERLALRNILEISKQWGIFGESRMPKILEPGKFTVLDLSLTPMNVRALLIALVLRRIFIERTKARRIEELGEIEVSKMERVPMPWVFMDEAHNFIPDKGRTAASDIMSKIIKEGRQPGITLVLATQRPERLFEDALAQCDMVISHRLTTKADLQALRSIMQTYMLFDITKYINELPKLKGTAIILDDNSERIYKVRIRPRQSWHAGSSPVAI